MCVCGAGDRVYPSNTRSLVDVTLARKGEEKKSLGGSACSSQSEGKSAEHQDYVDAKPQIRGEL